MTELKTLKDFNVKQSCPNCKMKCEHGMYFYINDIIFKKDLKQEAIKWIREYESTNLVCHQWMANTLRHFCDIPKEKKYQCQDFEKEFAIIQINKIKKAFNLTEEDLK